MINEQQTETIVKHNGNKVTIEDILGIKFNIIKGDFDKNILMSEDGTTEIKAFSGHLKIDDIKKRCINALLKFNTTDINILSSTHYTEDNHFFNIFSREIYIDGQWEAYWLKDIKVDLKYFII